MNTTRTLLLCSALVACSSDPVATPDAAVDVPVATDGPSCFTQDGAAPVCPSTAVAQADAMRPNFRITHIKITAPMALASPILGNTVNGAVHTGGFLWGLSYDLTANTLRTGALNAGAIMRGSVGQGLIDGTFSYFAGNAPVTAVDGGPAPLATRWDPVNTTITVASDRATSGMVMGTVLLPIFSADGSLLTSLPLENARITDVNLAGSRACIGLGQITGGRFNECTSNWQTADAAMMPYGRIEAVITARAARAVPVTALMTTLCNLLAGSNCETTPQAMWTRQPDAMAGTEPGYRLTTEFAAISARIR